GDELVETTLEVLELLDAHQGKVAIARVEEIAVDLVSLDPGPERLEIARRPIVLAIAEQRIEVVGDELGDVAEIDSDVAVELDECQATSGTSAASRRRRRA